MQVHHLAFLSCSKGPLIQRLPLPYQLLASHQMARLYIYIFFSFLHCLLSLLFFFPIFSFTRRSLFLNQGLVAFSENGLMIRWWSLGSAWWERLSTKSVVPVQCTKLIFVPPWESFSPNSSRLSIMNSILGHDKRTNQEVCSLFFLTFL